MTVDQARTVLFSSCALHVEHAPVALVAQLHHTFPKYLQTRAYGISEAELEHDPRFDRTVVPLCGTGHDNVHELIRRILSGNKLPPASRGKSVRMAREAITRFRAAALT